MADVQLGPPPTLSSAPPGNETTDQQSQLTPKQLLAETTSAIEQLLREVGRKISQAEDKPLGLTFADMYRVYKALDSADNRHVSNNTVDALPAEEDETKPMTEKFELALDATVSLQTHLFEIQDVFPDGKFGKTAEEIPNDVLQKMLLKVKTVIDDLAYAIDLYNDFLGFMRGYYNEIYEKDPKEKAKRAEENAAKQKRNMDSLMVANTTITKILIATYN